MLNKRRNKFKQNCRICKSTSWSVFYNGPIRMGKFGNYSNTNHAVWKCNRCSVGFLDTNPLNYATTDYREMVDGDSSVGYFYTLHDGEQADNLKVLGTDKLRGKVIADIGCGAGSFLDLLKGYASETIAIEPAHNFHKELRKKGHTVYVYTAQALRDRKAQVDIAVSFSALEHVEDPLKFLKEIKLLLKPGGFLLISTPNSQDWLLKFLPEFYSGFFYRYAHTWYFNRKSIQVAGSRAGFKKIEVRYTQRFDLSNALHWIRDHRPTGIGKISLLRCIDDGYREILEKQGRSDYLYAWLKL